MEGLFGKSPEVEEIQKELEEIENLEDEEEISRRAEEALEDPSKLMVAVKGFEKTEDIDCMTRAYSEIKRECKKYVEKLPEDPSILMAEMNPFMAAATHKKEDLIHFQYAKDLDRLGYAVDRFIETGGEVSIQEGFEEYESR